MRKMKPESEELAHEFLPFFRVYKSGRVEKLRWPPKKIPPSDGRVGSRDVIISADPEISARIFLPRLPDPTRKLPVVVYVHGGGFSTDSAFSPTYHRHVGALSRGAHAMAVSVEYRLAPEHPIPACYDDCWAALQWIAAHSKGTGPDTWLNSHADFSHVFLCGDSVGGNICHNLAVRAGSTRILSLSGVILVHPMFSGPGFDLGAWMYMCPTSSGLHDPRISPPAGDLLQIPCGRILVCLAEKDFMNGNGRRYYEDLKTSGWKGVAELVESEGEDHCFHLWKPNSGKALDLVNKMVCFVKKGCLVSTL